ncbi:hypothetical protein N7467_004457 [Penicillium canescens]|nr:hypothetical protein N7467_004457 [Penicillium canescens]
MALIQVARRTPTCFKDLFRNDRHGIVIVFARKIFAVEIRKPPFENNGTVQTIDLLRPLPNTCLGVGDIRTFDSGHGSVFVLSEEMLRPL